MLIRVEMGKGRKDRHAKLSPELLSLLRAWPVACRRAWAVHCRVVMTGAIATKQLAC
jgi:hypothetical protein